MRWSWKTWVMVVGFIALVIAAGTLASVGITTHTEPGLMGVCWNAERDNVVQYLDAPTEACPALTWNRRTLTLRVITTNPHPPLSPEAAGEWVAGRVNSQLDREMIQYLPGSCTSEEDICVFLGAATSDLMESGGDAFHEVVEGHLVCNVRTANTGSAEMTRLVLHHEIGHCLGLAHDDYSQSIMRRVQTPTTDGAFPPGISDSDKALLQVIYP